MLQCETPYTESRFFNKKNKKCFTKKTVKDVSRETLLTKKTQNILKNQ